MKRAIFQLIGTLGLILAVGCAASSSTPAPAQAGETASKTASKESYAPEQRYKCKWEKPIGSNISKKVCRSVDQIERERDASQGAMQNVRPQGGPRE